MKDSNLLSILQGTHFMDLDKVNEALKELSLLLSEQQLFTRNLDDINNQYQAKTEKILKHYQRLFRETFTEQEMKNLDIYKSASHPSEKKSIPGKFLGVPYNNSGVTIVFCLPIYGVAEAEEKLLIAQLVTHTCATSSLETVIKNLNKMYQDFLNKRNEQIRKTNQSLEAELTGKINTLKKLGAESENI